MTGCLVGCVLWHINLCRLFNAKFCLYITKNACRFFLFIYLNWRFLHAIIVQWVKQKDKQIRKILCLLHRQIFSEYYLWFTVRKLFFQTFSVIQSVPRNSCDLGFDNVSTLTCHFQRQETWTHQNIESIQIQLFYDNFLCRICQGQFWLKKLRGKKSEVLGCSEILSDFRINFLSWI